MFKSKNKKPFIGDTRITLDAKHNEMLKHFKNLNKSLPEKRKDLSLLKSQYNQLKKIPNKALTNEQLEEKFSLDESIKNIELEIKKIDKTEEENKYFLETSNLLCDYYNNLDKISSNNKKKTLNTNNESKNSVISFFSTKDNSTIDNSTKDNSTKDNSTKDNSTTNNSNVKNNLNKMSDFVITSEKFQRADMLNNYLKIIDTSYIGNTSLDKNYAMCINCDAEKILIQSEGIMVCERCGETDFVIIDSDKPSYKDPPPEISYFAYKRRNHFSEWLSQTQARESTDINQEIFDKLLLEIKKERITNLALLTHDKVRGYLKKLEYNKYYEHVPHIICRLNGKQPPTIKPNVEEKLKRMFEEIQEPFSKVCPNIQKNRKNFLSYSYVLHKFVELLGLDELKSLFPLLKSREKLHQQDRIWEGICKELNWEFIKSV